MYPGVSGWHFLTVPKKEAVKIKHMFAGLTRGFGSLPVVVTLGSSEWKTSIFPDSKTQTYLLPLKAQIRKKEQVHEGDVVTFSLEIAVSY